MTRSVVALRCSARLKVMSERTDPRCTAAVTHERDGFGVCWEHVKVQRFHIDIDAVPLDWIIDLIGWMGVTGPPKVVDEFTNRKTLRAKVQR